MFYYYSGKEHAREGGKAPDDYMHRSASHQKSFFHSNLRDPICVSQLLVLLSRSYLKLHAC